MGKYLDKRNMNDELIYEKEELMLFIANELAEANRLKRIELECMYGKKYTIYHKYADASHVEIPKEELEDKA